MRKLAFVVLIALIVLSIAFYYRSHDRAAKSAHAPHAASGPPSPALTLVDLKGNKIDTSSYAGKVVLVNFWAAWCTPCTDEIPKLVALQDKYRGKGLQVIGFSMEDKPNALREFYDKNRMNYPVIAGNQDIAQAYGGILGLPTSFLIDREGRIRTKHPGLADPAQLEREIVGLLRD